MAGFTPQCERCKRSQFLCGATARTWIEREINCFNEEKRNKEKKK